MLFPWTPTYPGSSPEWKQSLKNSRKTFIFLTCITLDAQTEIRIPLSWVLSISYTIIDNLWSEVLKKSNAGWGAKLDHQLTCQVCIQSWGLWTCFLLSKSPWGHDVGDTLLQLVLEKLDADYLTPCLNQKWLPMSLPLLHRIFIRSQIVHFYLLWGGKGREVADLRRYVCVSSGMGILTIVCFVSLLLKGNKLHSCSQMLSGWEMRSHCLRVICWYITFV